MPHRIWAGSYSILWAGARAVFRARTEVHAIHTYCAVRSGGRLRIVSRNFGPIS